MPRETAALWDADSQLCLTDYGPAGAQSASVEVPAMYTAYPWDQAIAALTKMRTLSDDWDGNGAIAPSAEMVDSALEWAHHLLRQNQTPPSSIMAGPNGTILFNWQDGNEYLDAEVTRPNYVEWMQMVPGRPTRLGAFEYAAAVRHESVSVSRRESVEGVAPVIFAQMCAGAVTSFRNIVSRLTSWAQTDLRITS